MTADPMLPPIVRMLAFMPLADPRSATAERPRRFSADIGRERQPESDPHQARWEK